MAKRRRRKKTQTKTSQTPKFPRRRWLPGQVQRVEPSKKGGPYDRACERRRAQEDIEDSRQEEEAD